MRRSQFGREYTQGKALSEDFRTSVVTSLKTSGAIAETGFIPRGELGKVSKEINIHSSTVKRIWQNYCEEGKGQRGGKKKQGNLAKMTSFLLKPVYAKNRLLPTQKSQKS